MSTNRNKNNSYHGGTIDTHSLPKNDVHLSPYEKGSSGNHPIASFIGLVLFLLAGLCIAFFFPQIISAFQRIAENTISSRESAALSIESAPSQVEYTDSMNSGTADTADLQYAAAARLDPLSLIQDPTYLGTNIEAIIDTMTEGEDYYYEYNEESDYDIYSFWSNIDYLDLGVEETWIYFYTPAQTGIIDEIAYYSYPEKTQLQSALSGIQSKYDDLKLVYGKETETYYIYQEDLNATHFPTTFSDIIKAIENDEDNVYYVFFENENNSAYQLVDVNSNYDYYSVCISFFIPAE